jgi:hypothetical protein
MNEPASGRDHHGKFVVGNQIAHAPANGGERGIKDLTAGAPLRGLAAESQREVEAELEAEGRAAIVRRAAVRLEAVSRLFFNAILSAADRGDFAKLAAYAQRFAWLQSRALAAWMAVATDEKNADKGTTARDVLDAIKGSDDEQR